MMTSDPSLNVHDPLPLELSCGQRSKLAGAAVQALEHVLQQRSRSPIFAPTPRELIDQALEPPSEQGTDLQRALDRFCAAAACGWNKSHPGELGYIPSDGLFSGAVAAFLAAGVHAFTGASFQSPALVAIEESVNRWLAGLFGLPRETEGILLSGGSMANQTAIICARQRGFDPEHSRAYLSEQTHHSIHKALKLCGIPEHCVSSVRTTSESAMDVDALSNQIERDIAAGHRPWLIVGTAGSTDTGAVDDLEALARICATVDAWLHVDAAYGGMFMLTQRGAARMRGIELVDSLTVDAHKGLMLPYGVAALLVRRSGALAAAHVGYGNYMRDVPQTPDLPNYFDRGPEMTRPYRGLLVWLPLQLHGIDAFRKSLDRSLDLASEAARALRSIAGISVLMDPVLSIVAFRALSGDAMTEAIGAELNGSGRLHVSSTRLNELTYIRLAFLNSTTSSVEIDCVRQIVEGVVRSEAKSRPTIT